MEAKRSRSLESALARRIAPAPKPELSASRPGCIKVRLSYLTMEPKHVRNTMLHIQGIESPYIEDIHILLPQAHIYDLIETFMPAFQTLQEAGLVSKTADLQSFKVLLEDASTLAYAL